MSLDDDFADARSTLENSAMLCTSTRKAVDEAFKPRPVCAVCGQPKMPHGRSHFGDGCTDSCEGYRQEPHPLNLFFGEQMEIRNLAYELPRILAALDAAEERARVAEAERDWLAEAITDMCIVYRETLHADPAYWLEYARDKAATGAVPLFTREAVERSE